MTLPTNVIQYAEDEITQVQWIPNNLNILTNPNTGNSLTTVRPLMHIARSPKYDLTDTTWFIECTGFNFTNLPDIVSGVTANISMNRGGRITDDIIQLCYQGNVIGESRAQPAVDRTTHSSILHPMTTYGGSTDTWEINDLTLNMVQDPTFGIVVRYKSHPSWPHKTGPILYSITLQIS
jgi:hypothetical protein